MNSVAYRGLKSIWRGLLWAGVAGSSLAWAGPKTPAERTTRQAPELKSVPRAATTAQAGPGLPVGNETAYAMQLPMLSIETSGPMRCNVGRPMEHQILVKNIGSVAADQVEVRGTFSLQAAVISSEPEAAIESGTIVWRLPRLEPQAEQRLKVRLKPMTEGELNCNTTVGFRSSSAVNVQVGKPKLTVVCNGPQDILLGADAHLMVIVHNTGTGTAHNVRLTGQVLNVIQTASAEGSPIVHVGTLEPGESRLVETLARAREAGTLRMALVAESDDGITASADYDVAVRAPKLEIDATGPDFRYVNRKTTYRFVVKNPGDAPAINVNLVAGLPNGVQYVESTGGAYYNQQKRTVEWMLGVVDGGQQQELELTVLPQTEGDQLQRVVAWADSNLRARAEKLTRVASTPSVLMEVVAVDDPIEVGSVNAYEIRVANRGSRAAETVRIIAQLPEGLEPVGANGKYRIEGQQVIFEELPALGAQTSMTLRVTAKGTRAGTARVRAELTSPSLSHVVTAERVTEVYGE